MKELDYRPNMFAKGMRTNCSHSVGIIFPDLSNPFFSEWYQVVDRISRERSYLNYICVTDPKGETEELRVDDLLARSIDGIILFSYRKEETFLEKLRELNKHTPVICCDSMFQDEGISCRSADGRKGSYDAVLKLYESGKRRITYHTGKAEYQVINNRFMGAVDNFFHRHMVGINSDPEAPGFQKIIFMPNFIKVINFARGSYNSIYGEIKAERKKVGEGEYKVIVPTNFEAQVVLPNQKEIVKSGEHIFNVRQ